MQITKGVLDESWGGLGGVLDGGGGR